jgi:predicted nucleotidyltransferase
MKQQWPLSAKKKIEAEIKEYFLKQKEIKAVYIFGSFLKESFNEQSDLDLAVIFGEEIEKYQRFKLKLKILYELEKIIEREIDLLDFESIDLKMQHQVLGGRLIYCTEQKRRVLLEKRAILDYINMRQRYEQIDKNLGRRF